MSTYPIVEQRTLAPVIRSFPWRARRELSELPPRPPGGVLVAMVDGEFVRLPGQLRGNEPALVNAASILVVDIRPGCHVLANVELASSVPGESFTVRVTFSCSVVDPVEVARKVPANIVPVLENHLKSDPQLMSAGQQFSVDDSLQLRELVTARIKAWCEGRRPPAPGMRVDLASIELDTPEDLRRHASDRREEQRRQELERLKSAFTFEEANLIEALIARGPEAIEALALKLDEQRFYDATKRAYDARDHRQDRLMRIVKLFSDGGQIDDVPLDTPKLVDRLVNSLIGESGKSPESFTLGASTPEALAKPSEAPQDEPTGEYDDDPPPEEGLNG